jgi:hypothetical protein
MKWDVFSGTRREKRDKRLKEIKDLSKRIERFAPPRYRKERTAKYYNYHTIGEYTRPLLELLRALSKPKRLREDERGTVRDVFIYLKAFYDIRDRLSINEALEDVRLLRKLENILVIFYGRPDLKKDVLIEHLRGLEG